MGAKTWMLVYAQGNVPQLLRASPRLDPAATEAFTKVLFPHATIERFPSDVDLSNTCPRGSDIHCGCFEGVAVVAAEEFGGDYPSKLSQHFLDVAKGRDVYLHAMHSVVDWFAYAVWRNGVLQRSLSVSPEGILEDVGNRFEFEEPYWAGQHPACEPGEDPDYPLEFHPLDLGEAALASLFGYHLEGPIDTTLVDPEKVPLARFKRVKKAWWKLW